MARGDKVRQSTMINFDISDQDDQMKAMSDLFGSETGSTVPNNGNLNETSQAVLNRQEYAPTAYAEPAPQQMEEPKQQAYSNPANFHGASVTQGNYAQEQPMQTQRQAERVFRRNPEEQGAYAPNIVYTGNNQAPSAGHQMTFAESLFEQTQEQPRIQAQPMAEMENNFRNPQTAVPTAPIVEQPLFRGEENSNSYANPIPVYREEPTPHPAPERSEDYHYQAQPQAQSMIERPVMDQQYRQGNPYGNTYVNPSYDAKRPQQEQPFRQSNPEFQAQPKRMAAENQNPQRLAPDYQQPQQGTSTLGNITRPQPQMQQQSPRPQQQPPQQPQPQVQSQQNQAPGYEYPPLQQMNRTTSSYARQIIAVHSPKGGVGKSTLAKELALALASEGPNKNSYKTLLIDMDWGTGCVASIFNISPHPNSTELIKEMNVERRAGKKISLRTPQELGKFVIPYKNVPNLDLLCASPYSQDAALVNEEIVKALIENYRTCDYDYIILDTANSTHSRTRIALTMADQMLLVESMDATTIYNTSELMRQLRQRQFDFDKVRMVINRVPNEKYHDIHPDEISSVLKIPIIAIIPDDEEVRLTNNRGASLVLGKETDTVKEIKKMINAVAPVYIEKKEGFFSRLFKRKK